MNSSSGSQDLVGTMEISEKGEVYHQKNSFNPRNGIMTVNVEEHGDMPAATAYFSSKWDFLVLSVKGHKLVIDIEAPKDKDLLGMLKDKYINVTTDGKEIFENEDITNVISGPVYKPKK